MAQKKNVLDPHYLELNQALATADFCMMIAGDVFSRLQRDYASAAASPNHRSQLFAGSCLSIREDRKEKYAEDACFIMYLPGAAQSIEYPDCVAFFEEMSGQLQLTELANCYEAWERFVKHTLAILMYQKRGSMSPDKRWTKSIQSKSKNTPSYFAEVAKKACRHNSDDALSYLSTKVPSLKSRASNYVGSNLYLHVKAIAVLRHAKVHSNGFIDIAELRADPQVRDFIRKFIDASVTHGDSRLKLTEKVASRLSCRLAEFGRVLYQTVSDFCCFHWADDFK